MVTGTEVGEGEVEGEVDLEVNLVGPELGLEGELLSGTMSMWVTPDE